MTTIEFKSAVANNRSGLIPAAYKLTRDMKEADDLIQDTLVKVLSNRDKFKAGTNLKAWMYTIMRNTFITQYHKLVRRKTFIDTTNNHHYIDSASHTVDNNGMSQLIIGEVRQSLESLKDIFRVPFEMHVEGYKYHEIADTLEIPIGTVKNRIHVARKELKYMLKSYEKDRRY